MKLKFSWQSLAIGGSLLVIVVVPIVIFLAQRQAPSFIEKRVDKDTGETIFHEPNKSPEQDQAGGRPTLLGMFLLLDNGMTQAQFTVAREALWDYSQKNLGNKYSVLKLLPSSFTSEGGKMQTKMRLGETENLVDVTFQISELRFVQVTINDPSGSNGGAYDSGLKDAPTDTDRTDQDALEDAE